MSERETGDGKREGVKQVRTKRELLVKEKMIKPSRDQGSSVRACESPLQKSNELPPKEFKVASHFEEGTGKNLV